MEDISLEEIKAQEIVGILSDIIQSKEKRENEHE